MKVFSYIVGAAKQLNMQPGTEIGDETLKYQELCHLQVFWWKLYLHYFSLLKGKHFHIQSESRFYQALNVEHNVKFLRGKKINQ